MRTNASLGARSRMFSEGANYLSRLAGTATLIVCFCVSTGVQAATVLSKAANTEVRLDVPYLGEIEFENPLTGTEIVAGHHLLEWRDADYSAGPPSWYDDWSVNNPGSIDGAVDQVWLRAQGDSAWTSTTVPSTIISIHLNGDNNDGIAQVLVDGVEVARLDMFYPGGAGGQWRQTVLVLVRGLPNTTHTIRINALGTGQGGGPDVAINGAAALRENPIKWDQPPEPAEVTNTLYYGWNELSVDVPSIAVAADDWVCNSTNPVTKIRWWGSFLGWVSNAPPPVAPGSFQILFWNDVPAGADAFYSHPGAIVWQITCTNFTWQFVGYDYDPRTTNVESCFLFEQTLKPEEYFEQLTPPGTIYWLSIAAQYPSGTAGPWPWGWKTRPRAFDSPAPDDAVVSTNGMPPWTPIFWPDPNHSWDLSFELISVREEPAVKWEQVPDLSTNGMDVHATWNPGSPPAYLLADDFLCTSPGLITNITIWGSWTNDADWQANTTFTLSIHDDIPASSSPTGYSMPGTVRWQRTFTPGTYNVSLYAQDIKEWWFAPTNQWSFPGDTMCFQYDFNIPPLEAFEQKGSPDQPMVYWLDVQAQPQQAPDGVLFGWKTCPTNWHDDAVWVNATEPYNGVWNRLVYPPPHRRYDQTVDLAFRLNAGMALFSVIKWSQPPVVATNVSLAVYKGWNEVSWYGGEQGYPIIADDWVCTTTNPVTDIHWWGSFLGWNEGAPPPLPDAFFITFWTDLPAIAGDPTSYSQPDLCQWLIVCTNYTCEFAGWDLDPRDPNPGVEACFKFHQDLTTNEWFLQDPIAGTNIYWISIAAFYTNPAAVLYPWGWKTRPRDPLSPAPDDAVQIYDPIEPLPGAKVELADPIYWPEFTNSWDMAFQLTTRWPDDLDFGDAPDPPYPTLLVSKGARHYIVPGFHLGALIDAEIDGLPNPSATGDDTNNLPDEDGVTFAPPLLVGTQAWANVTLVSPTGTGQLDAWMDFNKNGSWEASEQIFNNLTLSSGLNALSFPVPNTASVGPTFARFRLSRAGGLPPVGIAADGEVEDQQVILRQFRPLTGISITNIMLSSSNCTVYWTAETNVHYWLLATTNLSVSVTNWSRIGSEVIGPANNETEHSRWPTPRFYRVVAPYPWP